MARVGSAARASLLAALLGFAPLSARAAPADSKAADAGAGEPAKAKPAEAKPSDAKPKAPETPREPRVSKPAEKTKTAPKAAEPAKAVDTTKPVDTAKPADTAKATEATKSAVGPKPAAAPDPQRGVGTRSLGALPLAAPAPDPVPAPEPEPTQSAKPEKPVARAAHQKGKPPHKPAATLPADAARAAPDRAARQKIADGLTDEELRAGKDDPELRSLRAAERVLFPRPLAGIEPGWSWDLPEAIGQRGPEVITQGAPSLRPSEPRHDPLEGAPDAAWLKSLTMPNLPVVLDEFVIKYLRFYRDSPAGKSIGRVWAKKSGRYTAAIKNELSRAGVPTDLVWLSMIESGHNPTITSPAGAAGLWQFMPDAGRTYGLTVDRWVDERLDPERSTEAASRYLSDLYRRFGSWELAIASYNMGYGGLTRSIRKFNSNDFWELVRYEAGIPWETTLYVPKIFALAIVMNNKKAFGLDVVPSDPPETFDIVLVGPSVALDDVARAAGVPVSEIQDLNPGYLAGRTPPWVAGSPKPSWRVRVPAGKGSTCTSALARNAGADDALEVYVSKFGDTVESIANAHGASEARIRAINHVDPKEVLAAGTVLLVPRGVRGASAEPNEDVVVVPPREFAYAERARIFYRVLPSDSLSRVASVFSVSVADIGLWNALDESARLQPGMALQLFVDKSRSFSARTVSPSQTHVLVAGSPEFYEYFEGQNGRKRVVVSARESDTLATIGKRYGMTVGSMERVNRRSRTDKLRAGEGVVVYVDRGRTVAPHKDEPDSDVLASGTLSPLAPATEREVREPAVETAEPDVGDSAPLANGTEPAKASEAHAQ
ncbi:MAG TPA: transglycosylase SLT domain-containing protein [Polyangiaceae bacterium]|jgi:membrane-bound lytic murein transglycosylase D|nr:transglycosylase SLT domain-containing protein [Polyangiaceae bacterium]